jgi:hypothetical protein
MRSCYWKEGPIFLALPTGLLVAAIIGQPASTSAPSECAQRPKFGINLAPLSEWSSELPLADAFKTSSPWNSLTPDKAAFDKHGNPMLTRGQSVESVLLRELDGHYPAGVFVVTYEGRGIVEVCNWDVKRVLRERPGRIEVEVKPADKGLQVLVATSDPRDPVRDVRVYLPGTERAQSPFLPAFVRSLGSYGVLRFMDWQRTNHSPLRHWSDRAKPGDQRYLTERGAPLELMIDLANACEADPWFCMPHQADDDFVREFARMVKERLAPGRKVYVEYSNEVWNWAFKQTHWARDQGTARRLGDPAHLRYYSERSLEIFSIWERVFGGTDRLVRVLGAQFDNPWVGEQVLTWHNASRHADVLAVAPYFGNEFGKPGTAAEVSRLRPDALLDALANEVQGNNRDLIARHARLARKHNLRLVAYEGGPHLAGFGGAENNPALTNLFVAANRHRRMCDLYTEHLTNWFTEGGDLYLPYYSTGRPGKWGSWGLREHPDQPLGQVPKYRAVTEFIRRKELPRPASDANTK